MRDRELVGARPWKTYPDLGNGNCVVVEADVYFGSVFTGRTETFYGYYVEIISPLSEERWRGQHRHSLLKALERVSDIASRCGWDVVAIGRTPEFKETGLSQNSGYGTHPAYPDPHVHMLEPRPRKRDTY
jgi:hypothetical protein